MDKNLEFSISENTFKKLLEKKKESGFNDSSWDMWFEHILNKTGSKYKNNLEKIMVSIHLEKSYEEWIKNFSLNLNHIWEEDSAKNLEIINQIDNGKTKNSAIVIGAGPSIKKHDHLKLLANSNYNGLIICTDRALKSALESGITPEKFPKFFVVSIDPAKIISTFYNHEIIKKYSLKINGIFTSVIHPLTTKIAREHGIKIHWLHALIDYDEGEKSFNKLSALMTRAKTHENGLPAIQTGGNVGTSCWFIAWKILKCSKITLIGINHSWDDDDSWDSILSHCKISKDIDKKSDVFKKIFPRIYNPFFNCHCILDPIFQFYSEALKEFIARSPEWVNTINATEGGCIFGERITCMKFEDFLNKSHR